MASSDGRSIDRHLGQSDAFLVYDVGAGGDHRLLEERRPPARLDPHSVDGLAALLGDVDVVLARRAGPGAIRALRAAGVQVFALEGAVETALAAIARRGFLLDAPASGPTSCGPAGCDPSGCGSGSGPDRCGGGGCA